MTSYYLVRVLFRTAIPTSINFSIVLVLRNHPACIGNVLLDSLVKRWFNEDFDKGGQKAAIGEVSLHLLERLMEDRYINTPPPKSTGREVCSDDAILVCY